MYSNQLVWQLIEEVIGCHKIYRTRQWQKRAVHACCYLNSSEGINTTKSHDIILPNKFTQPKLKYISS